MNTQSAKRAIDRFTGKVFTNVNPVYGVYISGVFHSFHATEAEANVVASAPGYGTEFNGSCFQGLTHSYQPGELFYADDGHSVYVTNSQARCLDPVAHKNQLPFVKWEG